MSKGFTQEFIRRLKEKSDIAGVISRYARLDKKGRNMWACCPFHHEKTPSFTVNEDGQFFHCFGCGKGGDVITFVRDIESLDYIDAVKLLANWAGVELPDVDYNDEEVKKARQKKQRLLEILKLAAKFYVLNLNSGKAEQHIEYIVKRKISAQTIRRFGIGASLDFDSLPKYLLELGYDEQEILQSGVCDQKDGKSLYDSLGKRLIFPIINAFGEVVAFGGRLMEKADFAKYKNTRETFLFSKSLNLYNINLLKDLKQKSGIDSIIVVEGYMDALSLYQAGFKNVVASMGTALTKDQARLMKRYNTNIFISYDGDGAGAKATIRGLEILESENLTVKVVTLPSGKDPDDVIKENGVDFYKQLLDSAMPFYDYKLSLIKNKYDISVTDDRRKYVAEMLTVIKAIESAAVREEYLKKLRDDTNISFESLKRDLENIKVDKPVAESQAAPVMGTDATLTALRFVAASVAFQKRYVQDFDYNVLSFDNNVHSKIVKEVMRQKQAGSVNVSLLYDLNLEKDELDELNITLSYGLGELIDGEHAKKYFEDCVKVIQLKKLDIEVERLRAAASAESDLENRRKLIMAIYQKENEINALRTSGG